MFAFDLLGTPKIAFDSGHVGVAMDAARHLRVGYFIHGAHPRRGDVAGLEDFRRPGCGQKGQKRVRTAFFRRFPPRPLPRLTRGALRPAYRVCLCALDVRKICPTMAL